MKETRQSIIENRRMQELDLKVRKIVTTLNAGMVLLGTASAMELMNQRIVTVEATTQQNFIRSIASHARTIAKQNDLYASVMIAQAALESGWGQSALAQAPNHNLFGIKGEHEGQSVDMETLEDNGSGHYYQITDSFRKYPSYAESLHDYAQVLTGDHDPNSWRYNFYAGARRSQAKTYQEATAHLTGRYATDTSYGSKLNQLIQSFDLTQYDVHQPVAETDQEEVSNKKEEKRSNYRVKPGDYLYKIATEYGMTVDELKAANQLTDNMLYAGMELTVNAKANNQTVKSHTQPQEAEPSTGSSSIISSHYKVQAGDTCYKIARMYGISISELQRLNELNGYLIHPGQVLQVPQSTTASSTPQSTPVVTKPEEQEATASNDQTTTSYYVVQPGDTYWKIANQYGLSIESLQQLNDASDYLIHPGQTLMVGSTTESVDSVATSTPTAPVEPIVEEVYEVEVSDQATVEPSIVESTPAVDATSHYTIQAGDTLYSIANRYGLDVYDLIDSNNGSLIHPGQVLNL